MSSSVFSHHEVTYLVCCSTCITFPDAGNEVPVCRTGQRKGTNAKRNCPEGGQSEILRTKEQDHERNKFGEETEVAGGETCLGTDCTWFLFSALT